MTARETRLRERIDRLSDANELLRAERDYLRTEVDAVRQRDDYHGRLLLTMRARLREVQDERDQALAALWAERDMTTRKVA